MGTFAPASAAHAAPVTSAAATADYVCATLKPHFSTTGLWLEGTNCTGPTDLAWEYRTITTTGGSAVWRCLNWSYRSDESAPVITSGCSNVS
ncbi:hypothetical protein [Streptomyces sp. NPDC001604]|uniref:hypothetical protein n=1 Tax=Streptomyces sp. NPDC001604 TaxID=3364593 RepID=UPI003678AFEC